MWCKHNHLRRNVRVIFCLKGGPDEIKPNFYLGLDVCIWKEKIHVYISGRICGLNQPKFTLNYIYCGLIIYMADIIDQPMFLTLFIFDAIKFVILVLKCR